MKPKPDTCAGCPAYQWGLGFVTHEGPTQASVAIVGQGPGELEAELGRPFVGAAGQLLDRWLAGYRTKVWISNLVWCWLPERKTVAGRGVGNRPPTRAEAGYCYRHHLGPALRRLRNSVHLVVAGGEAVRFLYNLDSKQSVEPYLGSTQEIELPSLGDDNGTIG